MFCSSTGLILPYNLRLSLTHSIKEVFLFRANWELDIWRHCLAILFSGRSSRWVRNLRIFIKMVDLRESLHISFDYRVSRPKSLATRMLHALLQILEN